MYAGRIVEIGPVADVIHRPRASVHRWASWDRSRRSSTDCDRLAQIDGAMPRLDAVPARLRVPSALQACHRALPARASRAPSRRRDAAPPAGWLPRCTSPRSLRSLPPEGAPPSGRPRGRRAVAATPRPCLSSCAAALLTLTDVARSFDVSPPWLDRVLERKPRALLKAVDGVSLAIARGRDARSRRRVRLRQIDGRAAHRRSLRADARQHRIRRRQC